jgi:hypothetical protein
MPTPQRGERTIGAVGALVLAIAVTAMVGIGGALLRRSRAEGIALLGEPEFYARLGWGALMLFVCLWFWGGPRQPNS